MSANIPRLTRVDGLLHLETSALIAVTLGKFIPLWIAALVTLIIGIGKELWDKEHGGVASWHDIGFDIAGIALGIFLAWV